MSFHIDVMIQTLIVASRYIWVTLYMSGSALVIGGILGLGIALIRYLNVPILAQMMHWTIRFKDFPMMTIVIVALSFMAMINSSEIFRGVFQAVKPGQLDAARSLGMTSNQLIIRILLPQAFSAAIPMLSNLFIQLIKASALASMVSVVDVFSAAKITAQQNYRFLEAYIAVAIVYWGLSVAIEQVTFLYERLQAKKFRRMPL